MNVKELEDVVRGCPNVELELECPGADLSEYLRIGGKRLKTITFSEVSRATWSWTLVPNTQARGIYVPTYEKLMAVVVVVFPGIRQIADHIGETKGAS